MTILLTILLSLVLVVIWVGPTLLSYRWTQGKQITIVMGVTLGVWMLKLVLFSAIVFAFSQFNFFDKHILLILVFVIALILTVGECFYLFRKLK